MAKGAKLTVYVGKQINTSNTTVRGTGTYGALSLSGLSIYTPGLPLYTTATQKAFWTAVLAEVQAQIAALP